MKTILTIQSRSHPYEVRAVDSLGEAFHGIPNDGTLCLADKNVFELYRSEFDAAMPAARVHLIEATEDAKSYEAIAPVFLWLLINGLKRDGCILVVGGGVMQDIGCFIASVLFRGVRWRLVPTTLLAQCDSCIGSKSSINISSYKNQIGTFYPPHEVLLATSVLRSLPPDEIRSGLGEAIKLHLLAGEKEFRSLMEDLSRCPLDEAVLARAVHSSLSIKQPYIESDEFDRGVRNLLNYGHTFGHAYESATRYAIPHGIAVTLGMATATYVSAELGLVDPAYDRELREQLRTWHEPYGGMLKTVAPDSVLAAVKLDKKSTRQGLNCILTRGAGRMEKMRVCMETQLRPIMTRFLQSEI